MACSHSSLRQSLGIENANTVQRPVLLEENVIFEIFYVSIINYLLDLPPTDKNTDVALAVTYDKLKGESFSVSDLRAYTLGKVTWTVQLIRETVIQCHVNQT